MRRPLLRAAALLMLAAAFTTPVLAQVRAGNDGPAPAGAERPYNGRVTGNRMSRIYRYPWDRKQPPVALRIPFRTVDEAEAAGYHLAPNSPPIKMDRRITGEDADGFGPETNFTTHRSDGTNKNRGLPPGVTYNGPVAGDRRSGLVIYPWDAVQPSGAQRADFATLSAALRAGFHMRLLPSQVERSGGQPGPRPGPSAPRPAMSRPHPVRSSGPPRWNAGEWEQRMRDQADAARRAARLSDQRVWGNPSTHRFIYPEEVAASGGAYTVLFSTAPDAYKAGYLPKTPMRRTPRPPNGYNAFGGRN